MTSEGVIEGHVGRLREIKMGKHSFESPIASFTKNQTKGNNRSSVGMGLLNRFDMIVDFQGGTLFIKPNRSFTENFEYDMSGIKITSANENEFIINYVQANSPAAKAGINVGDKLLAINGKDLTDQNYQGAASIFKKKPRKVTLKILRGSETKEISYSLIRFI